MRHAADLLLVILLTLAFSGAAVAAGTDSTDCDCGTGGIDLLADDGDPASWRSAGSDGGRLQLDLFVMSLCPFAMDAQRALLPAVERFADRVDLAVHYIADEAGSSPVAAPPPASSITAAGESPVRRAGCAATGATTGSGPFRSLHGQEEVDESRRQLIVEFDYAERYRPYLLCRSRQGPGGDWRECARAVGLDADELAASALGPRGERLFRANIRVANELRIHLSPTLLVDGEEYRGDLRSLPLVRRLCSELGDDERCDQIPACSADADCAAPDGELALCENPDTPAARCVRYQPVKYELTVLNSEACRPCSTERFLTPTLSLFPAGRLRRLDVADEEGAALAAAYGIASLPAYIFSPDFARSPRFGRVEGMVSRQGGHYVVKPRVVGVSYWPDRPARGAEAVLFVALWQREPESEFARRWPGDPGSLQVRHLTGPRWGGRLSPQLARRVCLAAEQPVAYARLLVTDGPSQLAEGWQGEVAAAGADAGALDACASGGRAERWLSAARAAADSLDVQASDVAVLLGNRLLLRRATPEQAIVLWEEVKPD